MPRTDASPRPPGSAGQKPIDFNELTARCMGRIDLAGRVLARFNETALAEMRELAAAADRSDRKALEQVAHRFAGGALNVSAGPLAEHCLRLEREAAAGGSGELAEIVAETLEACREALNSIANRCPGAEQP